MHSIPRILLFFVVYTISLSSFAQQQDKEQSKLYMEQADLMMEATRAMDDARDLMITAANFDTTNIKANFEAGHYHIQTIGKHLAAKYFLRIARQAPDYRFDLEFWIGKSYHFGLEFDKALSYYNTYRDKLIAQPTYAGKDKVELPEVERKIQECRNGKEFIANPKKFSIVNMGREINSEFEDYAPVLNENEDEIVFTTRRRDGNLNENVYEDNKPFEDVFYSTKVKGKWSRAKNMGTTINTKYNNSNAALSADGKTLYMYNDEGNGDIYVSERLKDGTWGVPAPLPGIINSAFREESMTVTKDGKTIYFSSERPGGLGGSDIYSCTKDTNGQWTILKNLGAVINTELDEGDPFIDYDGKTLYFSSKGGMGMGGYDIFKTSFDAEKEEWNVPENLGYPINTPDDDIQFVSTKDGKRSYYASVHDDGLGYEDIYLITVPIEEKPAKPTAEFKYIVKVIDADSKAPLAARVKLQGLADNSVVGFSAGGKGESVFTIKETSPKDYKLTAEMEGYIFQNQSVRIEGVSEQPKTISAIVEMRKLKIGAATTLRNLYFDFAKASFKDASYNELNKLENMMKQNAGLRVEISGHTDNIGSSAYNKQLSQRRANAVKDFLTTKGIDSRRIKASGYGEDRPIASNDDDAEGREINRRVDFIVLGN